ncbi:hypothetical protein DFA_06324 [Cavenderia fasciculata]|uniref:Importin N-terminal domain-containing protein n=1 Tax=Cavenderia fasciculata TaxID=261658 RepID=F4PKQ3_CACFS|nr:uncharacterized protein DFA_06324 [Cavenderia fasciculata]EGG24177.1 hypothetical protein DFA_06324 [Cavenderia fasciculata]|eukprot:XP_004362028.1 hypothetical protein DFA_06324 [Cavenderia fasciculata]
MYPSSSSSSFFFTIPPLLDSKVSDVLNRFMNHQLAWTRIKDILMRSRNEKTHYFALSILERVIKRQWLSLTADERHPVLMLLLSMVGLDLQTNASTIPLFVQPGGGVVTGSTLIRKKANSLIAQIIVNECPNWARFVDSLIAITTQQAQLLRTFKQQQPQEMSRTPSIFQKNSTIETLLQIYKDMASYYKDNNAMTKETTASALTVFNTIFLQCRDVFEIVGASSPTLSNDIIGTLTSMFELVDPSLLVQSFPLLTQPTVFGQCRMASVLALIEFVNVFSSALPTNPTFSISVPEIFTNIVKTLSEIPLPKTFKEVNTFYVKHGVLLSNISSLLIQLVKSFTPILNQQQQQKQIPAISQSLLLAHTYITLLSWSNDPLIFTPTLEFWKFNFSREENPCFINSDPFYQDLVQPICRVIYKILKLKDLDLIENRDSICRGILYKEDVDDSESEEWIPLSNLISTTILELSQSYPTLVYNNLTKKFITNSEKAFSSNKFSSISWCLSKCLNFVEFEKTRQLMDNLYQYKVEAEYKELVYLAILFMIRNATNYLQSPNTQVLPFLNLLISWINQSPANGTGSNLLEMSIQTLLVICKRKGQNLYTEHNEFYEIINQTIYSNNLKLSIYQKNILFESIGVLLKSYPNQLPTSTWSSIIDPLNQLLVSKSFENLNLEGIGEWSNHIVNILSFNNALAKSTGPIYLQQLYTILPHLLELYKWSIIQKSDNISYQSHQLAVKKAIINLVESNCNFNLQSDNSASQTFVEKCLIPLFSVMVQDQSLTTPSSVSQLLPRILQFMTVVFEKTGPLLPIHISQYLTKTFLLPSLADAIIQSTLSKGQGLINRIWTLFSIILTNSINSISNEIIISYIKLLESCLMNSSPTIHKNALESLSTYLHIVEKSSDTVKSILFDKNLLFDLMIKLLDTLIGSTQDFQNSQEQYAKVIFELFMVSRNYLM